MTLQPETLIGVRLGGRYEIVSQIGNGRSGVVYKAIDQTLNRPVALKVMHENMEDTALQRFKREAMAAGALNHPNIVTVFDFGLAPDNFAYLALEFLNGQDLHTVLNDEGKLPLNRAVKIVSQICLALGHAHKRGVVHRDLKPSNIMLRDLEEVEDFVKIVDFGIAKRFQADDESIERLTLEGQLLGTPAYMSPEQCQATSALDARSDIYSLGCVFFRMLTGATPIAGNSLLEVINGHLTRMPTNFADTGTQIPDEVEKLILKALSKKPEDRQQSMFEFRLQLHAAFAATLDSGPRVYAASQPESFARAVTPVTAPAGDVESQYLLALKLERGDGVPVNREESQRWMRAAAERGHREAQYRLAMQGLRGENRDVVDAVQWLKKSAEHGFEPAQFVLANCYQSGTGVPPNIAQAILWYQESARQGNKQAEAQLQACYQRCYESGEDSEGMESWLRGRTANGDPSSLVALALYLKKRVNAGQNRAEIYQLLTEAAQKGELEAQIVLAKELVQSREPRDVQQAFQLLTAAGTRNPEAILLKAICYRNGFGTPPDLTAAMQALEQAAEMGSTQAQAILGCCLLLGESAARNLTRGIQLLRQAAADNSFAQWKLALCFKSGLGTTRDPRECEKWFKQSSEGRFDQGPLWVFNSPGLRFEEAVQTFQTLAAVDNKQAYHWLGICFEDGLGLPQDPSRALQHYAKAAQKGYPPAAEAVARLRGPAKVY